MFRGQEKPVKEITSPYPSAVLLRGLLRLQDPYAALSPLTREMDKSCQEKRKESARWHLACINTMSKLEISCVERAVG